MRFMILLCCFLPLLSGCSTETATAEYLDIAACDMAMATLTEPAAPLPAPLPAPDGDKGEFGGPIDTIRDAKLLIAKANKAVDRGTSILDAVERDGKVTVDIKLPKPVAKAAKEKPVRTRIVTRRVCDGTSCHYEKVEVPIEEEATPFDETEQKEASAATEKSCGSCGVFRRPRLLWRWRR